MIERPLSTRAAPDGAEAGTEVSTEAPARHVRALTDAQAQARAQPWVDIEVHQLSAGAYQGRFSSLSSERMHLVHEQQNQRIHKIGRLPENICTISFALGQGPLQRFSHFVEPAAWTFLLPESAELDVLVPAQVDTLYLCLAQDRLLASARTLNPRFWEHPPQELHAFNTPHTTRLSAALLALLHQNPHGQLSAQTETLLLDTILLAFNQATEVLDKDTPECKTHLRAVQRVQQARELIDASLKAGQLPSVVELCAYTGASARTLQYAFREVMQMSPVVYLRILRLNKVRSSLQSAAPTDTTVTQVATHWGFLHLGEFARDYQRLFGERPSETLGRSGLQLPPG